MERTTETKLELLAELMVQVIKRIEKLEQGLVLLTGPSAQTAAEVKVYEGPHGR